MVTLYAAVVVLHPVAFTESVTSKVPAPALPHNTVTLFVPTPDVIVPPEITQA